MRSGRSVYWGTISIGQQRFAWVLAVVLGAVLVLDAWAIVRFEAGSHIVFPWLSPAGPLAYGLAVALVLVGFLVVVPHTSTVGAIVFLVWLGLGLLAAASSNLWPSAEWVIERPEGTYPIEIPGALVLGLVAGWVGYLRRPQSMIPALRLKPRGAQQDAPAQPSRLRRSGG